MGWITKAGGDVYFGAFLLCLSIFAARHGLILYAVGLSVGSLLSIAPAALIGLRFHLLTEINGETGYQLPDPSLGVTGAEFKRLYNDKSASGRSKQSQYGLSDFFWYLLAPAHAIHQGTHSPCLIHTLLTAVLPRAPRKRRLPLQDYERSHKETLRSANRAAGADCTQACRGAVQWKATEQLGVWEDVGRIRWWVDDRPGSRSLLSSV